MTVKEIFSYNLRRLRKLSGLSQIEVARRTKLTHNFINDIENGKKWVSSETIEKLSGVFGVAPFSFFIPETISNNEVAFFAKSFRETVIGELDQICARYGADF